MVAVFGDDVWLRGTATKVVVVVVEEQSAGAGDLLQTTEMVGCGRRYHYVWRREGWVQAR